ncbi:MAG: hypothetical protein AAF208_08500 [Cyanobacteria bacterium P01_A01_bin.45]
MNKKPGIFLLFIVFLLFVTLGDTVLPEPMKSASYNTRTGINNFVIGLFPDWRPKIDPKQRTQDAIERTEGNK